MKTVVLDGNTLNPGDLSWEDLEALCDSLVVNPRTSREETLERARGADVLLTNKTVIDRELIEALPDLKYIGVLATGYNVVDVEAARERGIPVCNGPAYSTESVAQLVFAFILAHARRVEHHADLVRENKWAESEDFCFWDTPQVDLEGKMLGVIGFGNIGRAVARIGRAFGMQVLINSRSRPDDLPAECAFVAKNTLFARADFVTLHCPLTEENRYFVNRTVFEEMKKTAVLINTGRGPLVDETDLAEALRSGEIAGAGLDVMEREPPPPDHPLYRQENCLITPHLAWGTHKARRRLMRITVDNLKAWISGNPTNVVN